MRLIWMLLLVSPLLAQTDALPSSSLWDWTYVSDPQISPDGSKVAYVLVTTDKAYDRYRSDIWLIDVATGEQRAFTTHSANDSRPRWSPDGSKLAFLSSRDGQGAQIHILDMTGGEARALTELKGGAGVPVWSPDGSKIAFTSSAMLPEEAKAEKERKDAERETREAPRKTDGVVIKETAEQEVVIDTLRARSDGARGYVTPGRWSHIWIVDTSGDYPNEATRITHGAYNDGTPEWSADGSQIFFSALREDNAPYNLAENKIYRVPTDGSAEPVVIIDHKGLDNTPMRSPNGEWLAFTGSVKREPLVSYQVSELYIAKTDGSERKHLSEGYDRSIGDGANHDVAPPIAGGGNRMQWRADGEAIYFVSADQGQTVLRQVSVADAKVETLMNVPQGDIYAIAIADNGKGVLAHSSATKPLDLYAFDIREPMNWTQLTQANAEVLDDHYLSDYEEVWYKSFDDKSIQGWLLKPPNFDAAKKYPLILYIHGGPHTMYGSNFFHEFQTLAGAGYLVLITNPRGSTGYGTDFGNIIQYNYPGDDYKDLMAGVDVIIERGYVDESKLGVAGGSGGGLLTTWIVGQTERFAAAAAQRNVTNWHSFVGTADFNYFFVKAWFPGWPWEVRDNYINRSPLAHVNKVTTPVLLIHSQRDYRTPLEQSLQYYTALKMQQKKARLVVFPDESHGLSRNGRPSRRVARLDHIRAWFDEYMKPVEQAAE